MEGKVTLFNSDDIKIGETYTRRAAQLVRQQRAVWTDESCVAIRFHPGMENVDSAKSYTDKPAQSAVATSVFNDDFIEVETDKRMRSRRNFVVHTVALIPGIIFLFPLVFVIGEASGLSRDAAGVSAGVSTTVDIAAPLAAFVLGAWITVYVIHAYLYATNKNARNRIAERIRSELLK